MLKNTKKKIHNSLLKNNNTKNNSNLSAKESLRISKKNKKIMENIKYNNDSWTDAWYEWAEENNITDPNDCEGKSDSFIEGCKNYAEEYQEKNS